MIHQYKNNGYNIVLDVNSGSIHVVDDVVYDVLSLMDEENADRYGEAEFSRIADVILKNDYKEEVTKEDLKDVFSDLQELEENGTLFTKDVYKDMQENPEIEISVSSPSYAWIRLHGTAVFENNMAVKEVCMQNPIVKGQYQTADNPIFEVFYLNNAHGVIADFSGNPPYEF